MIYCLIKFGVAEDKEKGQIEDLADSYLSSLLKNWQIYDDYYLTWMNNVLTAHVFLARPDSHSFKYHSEWGKKSLSRITEYFKSEPEWNIQDDDVKRRHYNWKSAKFLYVRTHAFDRCCVVFRGNDGHPIPPYLIPITDEDREYLFSWSRSYYHHDHIWLDSGELEIQAYKQLADPNSELMRSGRDFSASIEKATGLPTYCYLMRYWGRNKNENTRCCPVCGGGWSTGIEPEGKYKFWEFHFRCDNCKIVSHVADSYDDERHARIGEYKIKHSKTEQNAPADR